MAVLISGRRRFLGTCGDFYVIDSMGIWVTIFHWNRKCRSYRSTSGRMQKRSDFAADNRGGLLEGAEGDGVVLGVEETGVER